MSSPVPVVFDHFGGAETKFGMSQPRWADLIDLVKAGKAYVKISGAYRASTNTPDYQDLVPYAKALIAANPDRIVWGSDWPHPSAREKMPDDGDLADMLIDWTPDEAQRKKILVDNPARLYGFE